MAEKISHLFVVGAGFSYNAGLPLTGDFTNALLNVEGLKLTGPSNSLVACMKDFVDTTFGNGANSRPGDWPALEDIFTLIDLAANTGHHLGPSYSAATLRSIRRALIVRFIRMLQYKYRQKQENPDDNWTRLEMFLAQLDLARTAVLSLNWDSVIEQGLKRTQGVDCFDYGCNAQPAQFERDKLALRGTAGVREFQLLKPHGSTNWLYCDVCREVLWVPVNQIERVAQTLFRHRDWEVVANSARKSKGKVLNPGCPVCGSFALGTRLATFSYRKALDFPMHEATWRRAEDLLWEADTWIFFGYSMPGADYEFKHLLKRVELSRKNKPNVILITGGTGARATQATFANFFGPAIGAPRTYFSEGLTPTVIEELIGLGALIG